MCLLKPTPVDVVHSPFFLRVLLYTGEGFLPTLGFFNSSQKSANGKLVWGSVVSIPGIKKRKRLLPRGRPSNPKPPN